MDEQEVLIKEFRQYLLAAGKSENTVETYIRYAKHFASTNKQEFNLAVTKLINSKESYMTGYIIWNAANSFAKFIRDTRGLKDFELWIKKPKPMRKIPPHLTKEEVDMLIAAEKSPKYRLIIRMLFVTGMRVSELVNLKLSDVDLVGHQIYIRDTKNKEDRVITIPRSLAMEIDEYIKRYRKEGSDYLFTSRTGRQMNRTNIWEHLQKLAKKVGIEKKITPHVFRHSSATYLLKKTKNLRLVQKRLGHKSVTTTQIYTHVTDEDEKKAAEIFDEDDIF